MLHRLLYILLICFLAGAAFGQYPATGNKSRLGWQTTADGLVWRGTLADTSSIKPTGLNNAYFIMDTVNAVLYRYIKTQGGWQQVDGKLLHVLEGGANSAGLSISGEATLAEAFVVVDGNGAAVWDGIRIIAVTTTRIRDEVTIQGAGLITITETAQDAGGTINIDASIPAGHIEYSMLNAALQDSLTTSVTLEQGGSSSGTIIVDANLKTVWDGLNVVGLVETIGTQGEVVLTIDGKQVIFQIGSNLSFPDTSGLVTLENNQGTDVFFKAGENVTLTSQEDTLTIATPLSLSVTQGSLGLPVAIVAINGGDTSTVWDGVNIVSYFAEASIGVTLYVNNESVTFYPIQDGNKGDVTVTGNGEVWNLNNGVVEWNTLDQGVKDSIQAERFTLNPVDSLQFVNSYEGVADTAGKLIWNTQSGTLHLGITGGIQMPLGQGEAHMVRNVTGATIAKGKVVYISGATGQRPNVTLADADTEPTSSVTFGITAEEILHNDTGFVFTSGYVRGINTSALTPGEALWLDTVAGNFTHTKPTAPVHAVLVGYAVTSKNNGEIFVKIQNGYELGELHDVSTQGKAAQDILRYNGTIWQPGKDTSLYNMDATLKGNRLVSMGNADLKFKQSSGGADFVQIRPDYVSVENTTNENTVVLSQYGMQGFTGPALTSNKTFVYPINGAFSVYSKVAADSINTGLGPDLNIDYYGNIKFRKSASGPLDSLYGKNSSGQLTAIKNTLADTANYIEVKDTATLVGTKTNLALKLNATDTVSLSNRINTKLDSLEGEVTTFTIRDTAVTTTKIATGAVTEAKLASGSVTGGKIANYSISAINLLPDEWITNDSGALTNVTALIDGSVQRYRKFTIYTYIDSVTTANKTFTLPSPSDFYAGVQLFFITENYNNSYAGTLTLQTSGTNHFRFYDVGLSKWVIGSGVIISVIPTFKVTCLLNPRNSTYYWIGEALTAP